MIEDPDHDIAEVKWADRITVHELMPSLLGRLTVWSSTTLSNN